MRFSGTSTSKSTDDRDCKPTRNLQKFQGEGTAFRWNVSSRCCEDVHCSPVSCLTSHGGGTEMKREDRGRREQDL